MISRRIFGCGLLAGMASGAEWVMKRGDAQHSGWQRRDALINKESVKALKLLWKRDLGSPLSVPVIMGPFPTHRGIKEVVIVSSAADVVHGVDADLGKLLWSRRIGPGGKCDPSSPALTLAPSYEYEFVPMRPVYAVSSDGKLHQIRPSDGEESAAARQVAQGFAELTVEGTKVDTTPTGCTPAAVHSAVTFDSGKVGVSGDTLEGSGWKWRGGGPLVAPVVVNGIVFTLGGRELVALDASDGTLLYSSRVILPEKIQTEGLAIANGHVCFGSRDGTLYCFAIPIEM